MQKLPFSNGFFSSNVHIRERSFWGATNWRAGTAIVHFGERCSFWGATNRMAVTAIVHFGEHCSFWGATNKSAVTAPQNEHMKKKPLENGSFRTENVNKIVKKLL